MRRSRCPRPPAVEFEFGPFHARLPRPVVSKPQRGQNVQRVRVFVPRLSTLMRQRCLLGRFRVFDFNVEVGVVVKNAGVEQFVFGVVARSAPVFFDELRVGKRAMRILVEHLHVRVRRQVVEVEVVLLNVLAVVALVSGKPEEALFENRIFAVPQRERKAEVLVEVGDAGNAVFAPAVRARASMIVRQILPGASLAAVILANRAPLALAEVGTEKAPRGIRARARFKEACALRTLGSHYL